MFGVGLLGGVCDEAGGESGSVLPVGLFVGVSERLPNWFWRIFLGSGAPVWSCAVEARTPPSSLIC